MRRRRDRVIDVQAELDRARREMLPDPARWLRRLEALGLPPGWFAGRGYGERPHASCDVPGFARVAFDGSLYQPDPDGVWALIWPVLCDWPGLDCADLLAVPLVAVGDRLADPDAFALRLGAADWLNPVALDHGDAVHLFRTPWAWFAAGCPPDGAVLLDDRGSARLLEVQNVVLHDVDPAPLRDSLRRRVLRQVPKLIINEHEVEVAA